MGEGGLTTMVRIVEVDIEEPLWDEYRDVMAMAPGLTSIERAAVIERLVEERSGDGMGSAASVRSVPSTGA